MRARGPFNLPSTFNELLVCFVSLSLSLTFTFCPLLSSFRFPVLFLSLPVSLTQVYFPLDPGYRETGRMLVESGLSLALEADRLPRKGGVLTPASGLGDVLVKRLSETGCVFE